MTETVPPASTEPPPPPYQESDFRRLFRSPLDVIGIVLGDSGRLAQSIAGGGGATLLLVTLLWCSLVLALPYGAVLGIERCWRVALLFVGSLAICFPSLLVFSAYVGFRVTPRQNLAFGLVITCVASLFTFGFFPIIWFLDATMLDHGDIQPQHVSVLLLVVSLGAGIGHVFRCLQRLNGLANHYRGLLVGWLGLFVFINYRMARLLELL
jgi:hypothetical protein